MHEGEGDLTSLYGSFSHLNRVFSDSILRGLMGPRLLQGPQSPLLILLGLLLLPKVVLGQNYPPH